MAKPPEQIREEMAVWFEYGECTIPNDRTKEQQAFDSGIMAAAEFVRRMMDFDESIALPLLNNCTTYCKTLKSEAK